MKHTHIAIIGAGNVGTTTAYALMLKNLVAEITLIDIDTKRCRGEILDLSDALPFCTTSKIQAGTATDVRNADIIIIAAGKHQEKGQTRIDLINDNKKIIESIIGQIKPINKDAIVIIVTNPVDLITYCAQQAFGLPRNQIFGTGTLLDSQRLRGILSQKMNIAEQSINAYILGEHGDSQFPAWSTAQIDGAPIANIEKLDKTTLQTIAKETRDRAYEIIACKGATYFGIATCIASMCESIIFNQRRIMPLSSYIEKYDVCLSMPVVLGDHGIEKVIDLNLNNEEKQLLDRSAQELIKAKKSWL